MFWLIWLLCICTSTVGRSLRFKNIIANDCFTVVSTWIKNLMLSCILRSYKLHTQAEWVCVLWEDQLCTWDSARWRRNRHVRHRRSWTAMLERRSGGRRSGKRGGGGGGGIWKERRMWGRRGGQALAEGRLSGIDRRCWLCVLREKAGRLCRRSSSRGVLKRLIERRSPPSSRYGVLVHLGVRWESQHMHVSENTVRLTESCNRTGWVINSYSTVHANVLYV